MNRAWDELRERASPSNGHKILFIGALFKVPTLLVGFVAPRRKNGGSFRVQAEIYNVSVFLTLTLQIQVFVCSLTASSSVSSNKLVSSQDLAGNRRSVASLRRCSHELTVSY